MAFSHEEGKLSLVGFRKVLHTHTNTVLLLLYLLLLHDMALPKKTEMEWSERTHTR